VTADAAGCGVAPRGAVRLYLFRLERDTDRPMAPAGIHSFSTESLAVLCATLALDRHIRWLLDVALAPLLLGLVLYAYVMARFDRRQLVVGRGDQWLTGGALAISALAAGQVALAARALHALGSLEAELRILALLTWTFAVAWLPVLLSTELLQPRLGYDLRRWSTVFPRGDVCRLQPCRRDNSGGARNSGFRALVDMGRCRGVAHGDCCDAPSRASTRQPLLSTKRCASPRRRACGGR
jgi:Voltage-dependent anion channel